MHRRREMPKAPDTVSHIPVSETMGRNNSQEDAHGAAVD